MQWDRITGEGKGLFYQHNNVLCFVKSGNLFIDERCQGQKKRLWSAAWLPLTHITQILRFGREMLLYLYLIYIGSFLFSCFKSMLLFRALCRTVCKGLIFSVDFSSTVSFVCDTVEVKTFLKFILKCFLYDYKHKTLVRVRNCNIETIVF
jgi:hypothetical protein